MLNNQVASPSLLDGRNPLSQEICRFLLQLVLIIIISKTISFGLKRFQQPAVIAEVIGGVLLGPTGLGRIPGFTATIFPDETLPMLKLMADFGLLLFLFLIGMELDPTNIGSSLKKCSIISISGMLLPFAISIGVSKLMYDKFINLSVPFVTFTLFCGIAMSITAFPVLARIMTEQNLMHTEVGQIALAAGIIEDGIAWCLLILVIALVNNPANAINTLYAFLIIAAFALFLWLVVRPLLTYLVEETGDSANGASQLNVYVVFVIMAISAFFTQAIGVDAIFGSFLVGLIVPHSNGFAIAMTEKIEDLVTILFLPLYFAYAGLGVDLSALNDLETWVFVLLVLVGAVFGKVLGCFLAARVSGIPTRESLTIGLLMNTKGLVELIVLNIGKNAGVLSEKAYAIFLVMALITTFMTVPLVSIVFPSNYHAVSNRRLNGLKDEGPASKSGNEGIRLLICLSNMKVVPGMMNLNRMLYQSKREIDLFALRLVELGDRQSKLMMASETMCPMAADPVLNIFKTFAQVNKYNLKTLFAVAKKSNFDEEILSASSTLESNFVIFPIEYSANTYPKGWAQKVTQDLFESNICSIAFFVDRGFGIGTTSASTSDNFANFKECETTQVEVALSHFSTKKPLYTTQSAIDVYASESEKQIIFFAFAGTRDDIEVCVLLNYLAHYPLIEIHVLILAEFQEGTDAYIALDALQSFPTVSVETNLSGDIIDEASELKTKDLVLVTHEKYTSDEKLHSWLDYECQSSFCIVKAAVEEGDAKRIIVKI